MAGISPKLPLTVDPTDMFYRLNKSMGEVVKQNLKMVILTAPGERIMDPEFGVGVRNYLFENLPVQPLEDKIRQQVKKYMPYLNIDNIEIATVDAPGRVLQLRIFYAVPSLGIADFLGVLQDNSIGTI